MTFIRIQNGASMHALRTSFLFALVLFFASSVAPAQAGSAPKPDAAPSSSIPTGILSIVAGNRQGYSGDGGPATSADMNAPTSVAVDSSGNLYIADTGNNVIRLVTSSTGVISTFAGIGQTSGYSGDGQLATEAKLYGPAGVALDSSGNLYIADQRNCAIRRVDAKSLVISTVVGREGGYVDCEESGDGGPATSARLKYPLGIAFDAAGNLYIADRGNSLVRKVDAQTQIITIFAGSCATPLAFCTGGFSGDGGLATAASLNQPEAIAFDTAGNLYIADTGNNLIRRVDAQTGMITTVAGRCAGGECNWGFTPDGGLATEATLFGPQGVGVDPFGNIVFSDSRNDLMREVNATTGILTTIAGNNNAAYLSGNGGPAIAASLQNPVQLAFDASGNLYFANFMVSVIHQVTGSTAPTALAPVISPAGATITAPESVTIADASPNSTIYYTLDGTLPSTSSAVYSAPIGIAGTATLTAFATAPGLVNSPASVQTYTYESPTPLPVFSPPPGTIKWPYVVTFTDKVPAFIYSTIDGSTPTTNSLEGNAQALPAVPTVTVKAFAQGLQGNYAPSAVVTAVYNLALPQAGTPTFSPKAGTYTSIQNVTIATSAYKPTIYYTLDGTTPTTQSTVYTGPISIAKTTTVKALATAPASGLANSAVGSATYTINLPVLASPTFTPKAGTYTGTQSVTLADVTSGAAIYYTLDGATPTPQSAAYSKPVSIAANTTIKAMASKTGFTNSPAATAAYVISLPTPTISPKAGTYTAIQTVAIADAAADATLYFTLDGTTPTTKSALYSGPISIAKTTTVKAIAAAAGYANSGVATAAYTVNLPILPTPTFSPAAGTFHSAPTVTIANTNSTASIYYTYDGSTPTTSSTPFSGPIVLIKTTTLKAIAVAAGYQSSPVATAAYSIVTAPAVGIAAATSVTSNSATLNGLLNPCYQSSTYWFNYGTSMTALRTKTASQSITANSSCSNYIDVGVPVSKLASKTTYYFQLVGQTAGGSNSSQIQSFTTE